VQINSIRYRRAHELIKTPSKSAKIISLMTRQQKRLEE